MKSITMAYQLGTFQYFQYFQAQSFNVQGDLNVI